MKYTQLTSYKKHLQNADPDHFASCYGVILANDFERKTLIQGTLKYMKADLSRVSFLSREEDGFLKIEKELFSQDLFSSNLMPIVIDHGEKVSQEEFQRMLKSGRLILLGFSKATPLLRSIENEGIILDLLSEKPWDRQKRWVEQLRLKSSIWKRSIPDFILERIVFLAYDDFSTAVQELEKLLCYTAKKRTITLQDLEEVCQKGREVQVKEFVENQIWGFPIKNVKEPLVTSEYFFHWLYVIKEEMRLGLKIKELTLVDPNIQLTSYFPKVWPRTLEKKKQAVLQKEKEFFLHGLRDLFEIEMMAKDPSPNYLALMDLFHGKLQCHRN